MQRTTIAAVVVASATVAATAGLMGIDLTVQRDDTPFYEDRGFVMDETVVKRIIPQGNSAIVEFYGPNDTIITKTMPLDRRNEYEFKEAVKASAEDMIATGEAERKPKKQ